VIRPGVGKLVSMADTALTFGAGIGAHHTRDAVLTGAREAEAAGFDVLNTSDHLGNTAPFAILGAAAAVTERIRLRTYVLNVYFWNSALLAREVATVDALSGGRLELGLGAGHMKREHEDAGVPFPPLAERVDELERVLVDVRRRLAAPDYKPAPVQSPVPLSIGAWSPGTMRVAVQYAEIFSLTGMVQAKGKPFGTFDLSDVAEVDRRLEKLHVALERDRPAGLPVPVLDCLLQKVVVGTDPEEAAAELVAEYGEGFSVKEVLLSPFFLFAATPAEALDELRRRQDRWGISSWCTHSASVPALAEVVAVYSSKQRGRTDELG
jgi:probable F420-dependent oxidoreductase